jgi:signal peptide peptidase SppA
MPTAPLPISHAGHPLTRLIHALSSPLAIDEGTLLSLVSVFRRKLGGVAFDGTALHAELGLPMSRKMERGQQTAGIAVIPVSGVIAQHPQSMGTSVDEIRQNFRAAMASDQVDAILLDIDSPGGEVGGVAELADEIRGASKPVTAYANGLMASAAYWLASGTSEIVMTPSGMVGSIGVYMLHEDWSRNLEQEGVRVTAISAGRFKTEGAPWQPLSPEGEAHYQERVDEVYGWFVKAVAAGRNTTQTAVRNGYGEGRAVGAKDALRAGLVDRVDSMDGVLGAMVGKVERIAARRGSNAKMLGRRLALDTESLKP